MTSERRRDLVSVVLLGAVFALVAILHGWRTHQEMRRHLATLVHELGSTVAQTAAASLRASLASSFALERELAESLQIKASFLSQPPWGLELLKRFTLAARLRHVLVYDSNGNLVAHTSDLPRALQDDATGQLDLSLEKAAGELLKEVDADPVAREWTVPEAGLRSSMVVVRRLSDGGTAVLVQAADTFARARAAGGSDELARRLEAETSITYLRFNAPAPPHDPDSVLALESEVALPSGGSGLLRIGIDRAPVLRALDVQRRSAWIDGAVFVALATAGAAGLLRLRRSRDRLRARVARDERLASLGRLAANIAHEVRNPLNAISLAVQTLTRAAQSEEVARLSAIVSDEAERLDRMVSDVLRAARQNAPKLGPIRAAELLAAVEELARPEAMARGLELRIMAPDQLEFEGDSDLLVGAAWNLLRNAFAASPPGERVEVEMRERSQRLELVVRDRGPGIPAERRHSIFEPFETSRAGGSGLGLPLALSAAEAHGGTVEVRDREGQGAVFTLTVPLGRRAR